MGSTEEIAQERTLSISAAQIVVGFPTEPDAGSQLEQACVPHDKLFPASHSCATAPRQLQQPLREQRMVLHRGVVFSL